MVSCQCVSMSVGQSLSVSSTAEGSVSFDVVVSCRCLSLPLVRCCQCHSHSNVSHQYQCLSVSWSYVSVNVSVYCHGPTSVSFTEMVSCQMSVSFIVMVSPQCQGLSLLWCQCQCLSLSLSHISVTTEDIMSVLKRWCFEGSVQHLYQLYTNTVSRSDISTSLYCSFTMLCCKRAGLTGAIFPNFNFSAELRSCMSGGATCWTLWEHV